MRPDKLLEQVWRQPFQPFRMYLTNGQHFDIGHPELILISARDIVVALPNQRGKLPERTASIDPIHITHVEPLNGEKKPPIRRKPRKR